MTTHRAGTVSAARGVQEADAGAARAELGMALYWLLIDTQLTAQELRTRYGLSETTISHLLNGHFHRFSTARLRGLLTALQRPDATEEET
jgi:predicted XRE-type DNA-binding protein